MKIFRCFIKGSAHEPNRKRRKVAERTETNQTNKQQPRKQKYCQKYDDNESSSTHKAQGVKS